MRTTGYTDAGGGYPYEMDPEVRARAQAQRSSYDYAAEPYSAYDGPGYGEEGSTAANGEHDGSSVSSAGLLFTEQRKIIVKHLASNSSEDSLRKLIKTSLKTVTADNYQLQHIEFPRDRDGRLRGHIFATFKTPEVARGVVEDLNGRLFQRKVLDVRMTIEGVIRGLDQQPHHEDWENSGKHRDKSKRDKKDAEGKSKSKTLRGRGHSDRAEGPPIIANGSKRGSPSPGRSRPRAV
ncbi:hypothetical protein ACHAQH_001745 [Verticillium albo-atrum]